MVCKNLYKRQGGRAALIVRDRSAASKPVCETNPKKYNKADINSFAATDVF